MYLLNPLYEFFIEESFNKIVRRFNRYDVSRQPKLLNWLIKQNKKYHPDNYGKLMLKGQETRIGKLAKQAGRKVHVSRVDDPLDSRTMINGTIRNLSYLKPEERIKISNGYDVIRLPKDTSTISKGSLDYYTDLFPNLKNKLTNNVNRVNRNPTLTNASQASHEADELSNIIVKSKKLGLTPDSYGMADHMTRLPGEEKFSHFRGNVLDREFLRQKKLDTIFGKNSSFDSPRSTEEIKASKKSLVSAYNDYIKKYPQEEDEIQNEIQKSIQLYRKRNLSKR